jgi:ubiquinone/menaquinone biosynthesis C-methylase UbiE
LRTFIATLLGFVGTVATPQAIDVEALVRKELPDAPPLTQTWASETFQALDVREGSVVADVAAGSGDLTVLLAHVVGPSGQVFAVDIDESTVGRLRDRIKVKALGNVKVIVSSQDDPKLPAGELDAVLIVQAYHEMSQYESMLSRISSALKPGGRLVIVDTSPSQAGQPRSTQVSQHEIAAQLVEDDLRKARFEISDRRDEYVDPRQWIIVARKP